MFDTKKVIEILRNRKFIIWGLGSLYDRYAHCIDSSKVIKYVDRNPKNIGTLYNGIDVIIPDMLNIDESDYDSVVLIVSSSFFSEISELAISLGFKAEQIIPISMLNIYHFREMDYFMSGSYSPDELIDVPGEKLKFYPILNNFHILNVIMVTRSYYEADVLSASLRYIDSTSSGIVLDVGSNVGNHAFFWHQRTSKTIHCFEGDALNFNVLMNNIALNDFSARIVGHNLCISDTSGEKYLFEVSVDTNYGANIAKRSQSGGVDSVRLDDIAFTGK